MNQEPTQRLDEIERVYVQRGEYPPAVDDIAWLLAIARAALALDDIQVMIYDLNDSSEFIRSLSTLHEALHGRSEGGAG